MLSDTRGPAGAARHDDAPAPIPSLQPDQPPLALLIDYDNTSSQIDVSDKISYSLLGERYAEDGAA